MTKKTAAPPAGPDLRDPVEITATIKSTRTSSETGERIITLSVPENEKGKVAILSIFDKIVFKVRFEPIDAVSSEPKL